MKTGIGGIMHKRVVLVVVATILLTFVGAGSANAQTVVIQDPTGDSGKVSVHGSSSDKELPYFDIARVELAKETGSFRLAMRLAAPVPVTPPNPKGEAGLFMWAFAIDTQPGSIGGYPLAPGQKRPFEYFVLLTWDGVEFRAFVIDRRPLAVGGEAVNTDVPFSFNAARDELRFVVAPALIGDPAEFEWLSLTALRKSHLGSNGLYALDFAPDVGPTNWP